MPANDYTTPLDSVNPEERRIIARYRQDLGSKTLSLFGNPRQETASERRMRKMADRDGGWFCHYCQCELLDPAVLRSFAKVGGGDTGGRVYTIVLTHDREVMLIDERFKEPTVDHKTPRVNGGTDEPFNLVLCCRKCNAEKGSRREYGEFFAAKRGIPYQEAQLTTAEMKEVADLLGGDQIIAYRPYFAHVFGGAACALLLSQFWFWTNTPTVKKRDGAWFWKSQAEITEETGLTRVETETARRKLKSLRVLEEDVRGVPATLHYRLNKDRLYTLLHAYIQGRKGTESEERAENQQTTTRGTNKPTFIKAAKQRAPKRETITDTTLETNQKETQRVAAPPLRVSPSASQKAGVPCAGYANAAKEGRAMIATLEKMRKARESEERKQAGKGEGAGDE